MPPSMLSQADTPTTEDLLEVQHYAEALGRFVLSCETPMTVGVQGEWGSGKSSLMKMVEERLASAGPGAPEALRRRHEARPFTAPDPYAAERKAFHKQLGDRAHGGGASLPAFVMRFETWQFGVLRPEALGPRLIQALTEQLREEVDQAWEAYRTRGSWPGEIIQSGALRAGQFLREGLRFAAPVAAAVVHGSTAGLVDGSAVLDGVRGAVAGAPDPADLALRQYREQFSAFVHRALIETGFSRVVVFIDDIDRVEPAHAVTMLEILKNFLDVPGCVFVLAIDYEVVRVGVERKFNLTDPRKAQAFFDKIIQVPFDVPIEQYNIRGLLGSYLDARQARRPRSKSRKGISKDPVFVDAICPMVQEAIGKNPRAFKRFVNTLELLHEVVCAANRSRTGQVPDLWDSFDGWVGLVALVAMQVRWTHTARWVTALDSTEADARAKEMSLRLQTLYDTLTSDDDPDFDGTGPHRAIADDAQVELGRSVSESELKATDAWSDLQDFMGHLLRVLDRNTRNGQFDPPEVQEMAVVSGFLSITSRGRPLNLSGRDKFERAIDALGQHGELLRALVALGYASRAAHTSVSQVACYRSGIYFQLRYRDGDATRLYSVFQVHADGHLLLRNRHGAPLTEAVPLLAAAATPYQDYAAEEALFIPPDAVRTWVERGRSADVEAELRAWLPTQWRGAKQSLKEEAVASEQLGVGDGMPDEVR